MKKNLLSSSRAHCNTEKSQLWNWMALIILGFFFHESMICLQSLMWQHSLRLPCNSYDQYGMMLLSSCCLADAIRWEVHDLCNSYIIHKDRYLDKAHFKDNRSRSFHDKVLQRPTGKEQIGFHLLIEYCPVLWGINCCHGRQSYCITWSKIWMFNIFIKSYQQLSREDRWGYNPRLFLWNLLYS